MSDDDGDIEFEENDGSNEPLGARAMIKQLRQQLRETQEKRDEYLDGWQRCKADGINVRKDLMRDAERRAQREKLSFIEDIIPVLDSFDMAAGSESWAEVSDGYRTGMEAVRGQLLDVLSRHGIERFGKIGQQFDPRLHEAVQEVDNVAGEPHSIVKVLRFGYKMGEIILRPAQVITKAA